MKMPETFLLREEGEQAQALESDKAHDNRGGKAVESGGKDRSCEAGIRPLKDYPMKDGVKDGAYRIRQSQHEYARACLTMNFKQIFHEITEYRHMVIIMDAQISKNDDDGSRYGIDKERSGRFAFGVESFDEKDYKALAYGRDHE